MPKVKNYFLVILYFFYRDSKIKKYGSAAFFKLEMFNCNVSFLQRTLTTVIVVLKFDPKCYCLSKSKNIGHPIPIKTAQELAMMELELATPRL